VQMAAGNFVGATVLAQQFGLSILAEAIVN
jgi:hypothetical protein